jgi:hypothetical protein
MKDAMQHVDWEQAQQETIIGIHAEMGSILRRGRGKKWQEPGDASKYEGNADHKREVASYLDQIIIHTHNYFLLFLMDKTGRIKDYTGFGYNQTGRVWYFLLFSHTKNKKLAFQLRQG